MQYLTSRSTDSREEDASIIMIRRGSFFANAWNPARTFLWNRSVSRSNRFCVEPWPRLLRSPTETGTSKTKVRWGRVSRLPNHSSCAGSGGPAHAHTPDTPSSSRRIDHRPRSFLREGRLDDMVDMLTPCRQNEQGFCFRSDGFFGMVEEERANSFSEQRPSWFARA